jgi:inner membrane protein
VGEDEIWQWIWLFAAAAGILGEIATAGTFVLLPFGIGAAVACVLAFLDVNVAVQWIAFLAISFGGFAATRPLVRRLDAKYSTDGIGASRWIGQPAVVLGAIPEGADETGLVRVGREEWRAQAHNGRAIGEGTRVKVLRVTGTRLVVEVDDREPAIGPGMEGEQ